MKNITFFLVFIFSIMNAQVSEKITLPDFYNSQLARMSITSTVDDINSYSTAVSLSLVEANENSKLYQVKWLRSDKSRTSLDMIIYFYDTYILINTYNYSHEKQKIVKGKKVYQEIEFNEDVKSRINMVTDELADFLIKKMKTKIWD